jgi:phenylacetate-CoA ligase
MRATLQQWLPNEQQIFDRSPAWLKRVLVNAEALRRDWFRRYGDYAELIAAHDPRWYEQPREVQEAYQLQQLNHLLDHVRRFVPHYRERLPSGSLHSMADLEQLPFLERSDIRDNPLSLIDETTPHRQIWARKTSGSTGTPLTFRVDREATRRQWAIADSMLAYYGCGHRERHARFSGAYVAPFEKTTPPFWIYVDHYRQLQCSAYHLAPQFYPHYLRALHRYRVVYGTGYATAWHLLATHILESGSRPPALKAIFTDSEGINLEQQATIERAFGCPVYQTYGTGEIERVPGNARTSAIIASPARRSLRSSMIKGGRSDQVRPAR